MIEVGVSARACQPSKVVLSGGDALAIAYRGNVVEPGTEDRRSSAIGEGVPGSGRHIEHDHDDRPGVVTANSIGRPG